MDTQKLERLVDRTAIVDAVTSIASLADLRDWDGMRAVVADEIHVDYTSLRGGEPALMAGDDFVAGVRDRLGKLTATQHLVSNHLVEIDGDRARCRAQVIARHHQAGATGGAIWAIGGRYDYRLERDGEGWQVCSIKLTKAWTDGDQHLGSAAAARVGS